MGRFMDFSGAVAGGKKDTAVGGARKQVPAP